MRGLGLLAAAIALVPLSIAPAQPPAAEPAATSPFI